MDALFVIVAELLLVPLVLWALIVLELVLALTATVMSFVIGRRSAKHALQGSLRVVRRRLLWSMIMLSSGLLIADLLVFDGLVALAMGSANERDDLEVSYASAEGSFILGRIELHHMRLSGTRGGAEPSAEFEVEIDELVIDIDTAKLFRAQFAVEEIAVDGVQGSFDRLRSSGRTTPEKQGFELAREFSVERLHFGAVEVELRDHTKVKPSAGPGSAEPSGPREFAIELLELDVGPLHSKTALFDLLYRVRGSGSIAGLAFELSTGQRGGQTETTLELPELPLELIADRVEAAAGLRVGGSASLTVVDRYRDDPPEPRVELGIDLRLQELELEPGKEVTAAAKLMLIVAERALAQLGRDFPLRVELTLLRSELEGVRSLADSGLVGLVSDGIVTALREQLQSAPKGSSDKGGALLDRLRSPGASASEEPGADAATTPDPSPE